MGVQAARSCGNPEILPYCLEMLALSQPTYEGRPYVREAVALRRKLGNNPAALAESISLLAHSLYPEEEPEKEALFEELLALRRQISPSGEIQYANDFFTLGQFRLTQGKVEEAEGLLRKTVELYGATKDPNEEYHVIARRFLAEALARQHKWDEAEKLVLDQLHAFPANAENLTMLVRLKTCRGDLEAAIDESSNALQRHPNDIFLSLSQAVALLQAGRLEQYRLLCHKLLETGDVGAVKVALCLPVDGADFQRVCQLADAQVKPAGQTEPKVREDVNEALAEFHRGQFAAANDWAKQVSPEIDAPKHLQAQARFIEALAFARLGQVATAREALGKGEALLSGRVDFIGNDYGGGWGEWTLAERLHGQAAELLNTLQPQPSAEPKPPKDQTPPTDNASTNHSTTLNR